MNQGTGLPLHEPRHRPQRASDRRPPAEAHRKRHHRSPAARATTLIRFGGWTADGHPFFRDAEGRVLGGDDVADPARRSAAAEIEAARAEAARARHASAPEVRERACVAVPDDVDADAPREP